MKCRTKSCIYPATHGDLCAQCARIQREPRLYGSTGNYSEPNISDNRKLYERNRSRKKREKNTIQSVILVLQSHSR